MPCSVTGQSGRMRPICAAHYDHASAIRHHPRPSLPVCAACGLSVVVVLARLGSLLVGGLKASLQTSTPLVVMIPHLMRSRSDK
jgi:hypothetical protein